MAVADFTNPKLTQDYTTLLQSIRDLSSSQALMHDSTGIVNVYTNTIRWSGSNNRFEKFDGTSWNALTVTYSFSAGTFNSSGTPVTVNSSDSTGTKIQFQDAGVARGFIGASSAYSFYVRNGGNTTTPFSVDTSGNGVFSGGVTAGAITATTGTYSGALAATTGTFSSSVSATAATLTGTLTGVAANFSGDLRTWRASATNTGVIYFTQSAQTYLYYDGSNFQLQGGGLVCSGNVTAYSDERLKENWGNVSDNFIEKLSYIKSGTFDRTDIKLRQIGVSAQSLDTLIPEAVEKGGEYMSVSYGNAALVAAIELAKEVVLLRARLDKLENK